MRIFKLNVFAFTMLLALSGCFKPQGKSVSELNRLQEEGVGNASWLAGEISGHAETAKVDSTFQIPQSRLYSFTVCVKDRRTQEPLYTQSFKVETSDGEKTLKPDTRGCLNWSEDVAFNFLADSKVLKLSRTVTAEKGGQVGARTFQFGINPWSGAEVLDLSKVSVSTTQSIEPKEVHAQLVGAGLVRPLWIDGLKVDTTHVTGTGKSKIRLLMTPKIWVKNEKGEAEAFTLKAGKFNLKVSLNAVGTQDRDRATLAEIEKTEVEMSQNVLLIEQELNIQKYPATGRIELDMNLEAIGGPSGLAPFSGTFLLGDADALRGSKSFTLDPTAARPELKTDSILLAEERTTGKKSKLKTDLRLSQNEVFDVSTLSGHVENIDGDNSYRRSMSYTVSACLTDPNDSNRKLRDMSLEVLDGKGKAISCVNTKSGKACVTDQDGCVLLREHLTHNYYEKERYIIHRYTFKTEAGEVTRSAAINPWEPDSIFFFLQDMRVIGEAKVKAVNERKTSATFLFVPAYTYSRIRTRYDIDAFLNLNFYRTLQFTLEPRVVRDTIRRGRYMAENLRSGIYLLKTAVGRDFKDSDRGVEFVSAVSQLVRVLDGKIITPVEFKARDLNVLSLRSQLIFEISPLDPGLVAKANGKPLTEDAYDKLIDRKSDLQTRSFLGPVMLDEKNGYAFLRPTDDLSETYCHTIDCDALKANLNLPGNEANGDVAKFFGSLKQLANISVSKLIPVQKKNEQDYIARSMAQTTMSRIVKLHNAEYIPLQNAQAIAKADPELYKLNYHYNLNANPAEQLLAQLNQPLPTTFSISLSGGYPQNPANLQSLGQLIHGFNVSSQNAVRLCAYWMKLYTATQVDYRLLTEQCFMGAQGQSTGWRRLIDKKIEAPFIIEPKVRVLRLGDSSVELGQKMVAHVGASFAMGHAEEVSRSNTMSVSPTAWLKLIPSKIFTALTAGFNWTLSRTKAEENATARHLGMDAGVGLNIERAIVHLKTSQYERCASVRLNPEFIKHFKLAERLNAISKVRGWSAEQQAKTLTRSWMLCKGFVENTPLDLTENYYYISGQKGEERMLDLDEAQTQPWSLSLRGEADYQRFMGLIEARPDNPDDIDKKSGLADAGFERVRAAYRFATPTYPTLYSIDVSDSVQGQKK